jgi:hypothetical protein
MLELAPKVARHIKYAFVLTHSNHTSHEAEMKLPTERGWLCNRGIELCHCNN